MSEDLRRDPGLDKSSREIRAVEDYVDQALRSSEVHVRPGEVPPYIERVYKHWSQLGSPAAVLAWQESEVASLSSLKEKNKSAQARHVASFWRYDSGVARVSQGVQLPLLVTLMRQAGMPMQTVHFIREVFEHGAQYAPGPIPLTGLYKRVSDESAQGK